MSRKTRKILTPIVITVAALTLAALLIIFTINSRKKTIEYHTQIKKEHYELVTAGINERFSNSIEVRNDIYDRNVPFYIKYNIVSPIESENEFLEKSFAMYICGEQIITELGTDQIDVGYNSIGFYCGDYRIEYHKYADEVLVESDIPNVEMLIKEIKDEYKEKNPEYKYPSSIFPYSPRDKDRWKWRVRKNQTINYSH